MARQRKPETHKPDPAEQQMREETAQALNAQLKSTFERIQHDYAGTGKLMAEAANAALEDQEFVDFLFGFYDSVTTSLQMTGPGEESDAYPQALTTAIFIHKWGRQKAMNRPCHAEDLLVGNRYLRRFLREFFRDIYAANGNKAKLQP